MIGGEIKMSDYHMHILTLDDATDVDVSVPSKSPPPVVVYSCYLEKTVDENTDYFIPTITTDGRISFLPGGKADDLGKLQQAVSARFASVKGQFFPKDIHDISVGNFAVVGVALHLPNTPDMKYIIFETLVFPKPLPELAQIYALLKAYTAGDAETRTQIESFFAQEQPKNWINGVIEGWKQRLDWEKYVDNGIEKWERNNKR